MDTGIEDIDLEKLPRIDIQQPRLDAPIRNVDDIFKDVMTPHDKIANFVTRVAGSMYFIYVLVAFVVLWMITNVLLLKMGRAAFDEPWDFSILLLISNQVQLLTPLFILVSQNRQLRRDSIRADQEYSVSVRTEAETTAMFEYLRQMADRQDTMLRILDLHQRKMIAMKETSSLAVDRVTDAVSETLVSLVKAMEGRPCLADVVEMNPEIRERILGGLGLIQEPEEGSDDPDETIEEGETDV